MRLADSFLLPQLSNSTTNLQSAGPLVVSYGVGVDSTAMLIAMYQRGIRPDLILFSDTGAELPETYAYLSVINAWLESVGFPTVTVVRYQPKRAKYSTLEGKCLNNQTLPSLAFGKHSCSIVFKAYPQEKFVQGWQPAIEAWAAGQRVLKAIGYDSSDQDCRRRVKADKAVSKKAAMGDRDAKRYTYLYPLQDWHLDRLACIALIEQAGLTVPCKSACFFCPASKKHEIIKLRDTHPVLFQRALKIERTAKFGKHGLKTVKGLGRNFAWAELRNVATVPVQDEGEILRP